MLGIILNLLAYNNIENTPPLGENWEKDDKTIYANNCSGVSTSENTIHTN